MGDWPFADTEYRDLASADDRRAEDRFLLWLMRLPLVADPARAADRLLACAPPARGDTPLQARLRALLTKAARPARAA